MMFEFIQNKLFFQFSHQSCPMSWQYQRPIHPSPIPTNDRCKRDLPRAQHLSQSDEDRHQWVIVSANLQAITLRHALPHSASLIGATAHTSCQLWRHGHTTHAFSWLCNHARIHALRTVARHAPVAREERTVAYHSLSERLNISQNVNHTYIWIYYVLYCTSSVATRMSQNGAHRPPITVAPLNMSQPLQSLPKILNIK